VKFIRQLWNNLTERAKKGAGFVYRLPYLHPVLRVTGHTARDFYRDDCLIMAAAISFYAILSLIPFLLLLISIAGYVLNNLGQDYASQDDLFKHLATYVQAVMPFLGEDFIGRLRGMITNREAYGITGLIILLITSGLVFRTLELAFARVFKTKRHRSMVASQLLFVVFIMSVGLLFLGVHYLGVLSSSFYSARDVAFNERFDQFLSEHVTLRILVTIVTASLVFVTLLKYFSKERVPIKYALAGGLLFSLMWMLAIQIFGYYLTHVARFSLLYGSLATLAIIVVWIFYSACILLLCAEFTCVIQTGGSSRTLSAPSETPSVQ